MSDDILREQLSAMMDGELPADCSRFLSKRLGIDPELAATWERWHCVRDILRRQGRLAPSDFCARVREAIDQRESMRLPRTATVAKLRRGLVGAAIAAGVAALALFVGKPTEPSDPVQKGAATLANVASVTTRDLTPNWRLSPVVDRQSFLLAEPKLLDEFDAYFVEHGLANGTVGPLGVVSFVSVVATPDTRDVSPASSQHTPE